MNIIKQAAEAYAKDTQERLDKEHLEITHRDLFVSKAEQAFTFFLSYLSQQGDAAIARSIIEGSISTWYNQDDAEELLCKALAIGRATNRWIPVSERLPEDGSYCWFLWNKVVVFGNFYKKDDFDRDNVFVSIDGGHFLKDVTDFVIISRPEPPKSEL